MNSNPKTLYETILKYIDISFLNKDLCALMKTNAAFRSLIIKLISSINYYESNHIVEENNYSRLITAYNTINNLDFEKDKILFVDDSEFDDIANYFPIFIKNTFNKDFIEFENAISNSTSVPIVESEVVDNPIELNVNNDNSNNKTTSNTENNDKEFNAESFINQNGYSINDIADQMIIQTAQAVLRQRIFTGEVYQYQTKPKFIFGLKILSIILFISVMIISIISIGFSISISGKITIFGIENNGNAVIAGTFNISAISIISLIFYLAIVGFIIWGLVRNNKNENYRYKFNWGMPIFYLAISLIMILSNLNTEMLQGYDNFISNIKGEIIPVDQKPSFNLAIETNLENIKWFNAYRISEFVKYGILGCILIIVVLGICFNPKRDIARLQALIEQYAVEIKNGTLDTSSFGNGPGFVGGISSLF